MSTLSYILLFTFVGSLLALVGGLILLTQQKLMIKISHLLASFAAGVLLGTAFFDLLPEAVHEGEEKGIDVFLWTVIGIVGFFLLERFIHWFHHHEDYHDPREKHATLPLVIVGDTMHNFLDGVVIAAIISEEAKKFPNVIHVNPQNVSISGDKYGPTSGSDGFHPNDEGHRFWFDLIKPSL